MRSAYRVQERCGAGVEGVPTDQKEVKEVKEVL